MRLDFRQRLFLGLVALGTVPLGIALLALALEVGSTGSSVGPRAALDEVAQSGRAMIATLDTVALGDTTRAVPGTVLCPPQDDSSQGQELQE